MRVRRRTKRHISYTPQKTCITSYYSCPGTASRLEQSRRRPRGCQNKRTSCISRSQSGSSLPAELSTLLPRKQETSPPSTSTRSTLSGFSPSHMKQLFVKSNLSGLCTIHSTWPGSISEVWLALGYLWGSFTAGVTMRSNHAISIESVDDHYHSLISARRVCSKRWAALNIFDGKARVIVHLVISIRLRLCFLETLHLQLLSLLSSTTTNLYTLIQNGCHFYTSQTLSRLLSPRNCITHSRAWADTSTWNNFKCRYCRLR